MQFHMVHPKYVFRVYRISAVATQVNVRKNIPFLSILVYENVINKNKPQINAQMKYCKYLLELFNEVSGLYFKVE